MENQLIVRLSLLAPRNPSSGNNVPQISLSSSSSPSSSPSPSSSAPSSAPIAVYTIKIKRDRNTASFQTWLRQTVADATSLRFVPDTEFVFESYLSPSTAQAVRAREEVDYIMLKPASFKLPSSAL